VVVRTTGRSSRAATRGSGSTGFKPDSGLPSGSGRSLAAPHKHAESSEPRSQHPVTVSLASLTRISGRLSHRDLYSFEWRLVLWGVAVSPAQLIYCRRAVGGPAIAARTVIVTPPTSARKLTRTRGCLFNRQTADAVAGSTHHWDGELSQTGPWCRSPQQCTCGRRLALATSRSSGLTYCRGSAPSQSAQSTPQRSGVSWPS
jgi:hypothetical protein